MRYACPETPDHELYVVEDACGFLVVRVTEDDDEQASPTFDTRLQAEHYLWRMLKKGAAQ